MFRKGDFKKLDLLGSGKKHTKIYKVQHIQTEQIYALKEVEAKTLDKLNEYKEEAVQLAKVQNHPNIMKFYGYYFSETAYNTYRLGLITEYMDHSRNLEQLYRTKKQKKHKSQQMWEEKDLVDLAFSLISSCSFLQQKGICHRDIKPANLFLLENGEGKLIDFGESKDYFYDPNDEDRNTYTVATIRGTPQYLSPLLWKAHVIDGNSRYAEHNIYKSDVFSCGLVLLQLALMEEVTGYNNKTTQNNGEKMIKKALHELEGKYNQSFINIIALMLIFEESNRPSFTEIEQLFIEHEQQIVQQNQSTNGDQQPKKVNEYIQKYNQRCNTLLKKQNELDGNFQSKDSVFTSTNFSSSQQQNSVNTNNALQSKSVSDIQSTNKKQNYFYKDTTLILNENCFWFEFGGVSIGRFSVNKQRWKTQQVQDKFPFHFVTVFVPEIKTYFLLGGQLEENVRVFANNTISLSKFQMPTFRNFFPAVYLNNKIFVFGGYDGVTKDQLKTCEYFDIKRNKWNNIQSMIYSRSQASACMIDEQNILVLGGYNKDMGTLTSIEKYNIEQNKWQQLPIELPIPLRRFVTIRVEKHILLILGGVTTMSQDSQKVYKFDFINNEMTELESLEKGGVIENEVLVDQNDNLHIFLEHANGTSPHSHIKYYYDPNATKYVTKQDN